jgi:hypothetical protein
LADTENSIPKPKINKEKLDIIFGKIKNERFKKLIITYYKINIIIIYLFMIKL